MITVTCTKENPWSGVRNGRVMHPDAVSIDQEDGYPCGDYEVFECPHCKLKFKVELPQ